MSGKIVIYFILVAACFLAYSNSFTNAFISDDNAAILENQQISHFFRFWLDPPSLFNSFSYLISGYRPFPYHFISIILHSINSILVFAFLNLFFKSFPSFLGALLFAVHPVHTEAVTWISGKPYLFLALFILSIYLLYYRATNPPSGDNKFIPSRYVLALFCFSYAVISTNYFIFFFPFLLVLSDITFNKWRKNWKFWIPFLIIVIFRVILLRDTISYRSSFIADNFFLPTIKNPLLCFSYSFYSHLWLLIWPAKLTLHRGPIIFPQFLVNYSLFFLIPIILILPLTFKKAKELFFAIGIFILFLAPTYSPMPIASLVAERYIYLPSIALSIFVAFLYERCANRYERLKKYLLAMLILAILSYGVRTIFRNQDWHNPATFWRKTVAGSPNSPQAHANMGMIFVNEGNNEKAIEELKKALEINPKYTEVYNNLGVIYYEIGDEEEAITFLNKALEINPRYADPYNNLGVVYDGIGDKKKAIIFWNKAIEAAPGYVKAYYNLGLCYLSLGRYKEAAVFLKKTLEMNPNYAEARFNLSIAYFNEKEYALAIKHCDEAMRLGYKVPLELLESLRSYR